MKSLVVLAHPYLEYSRINKSFIEKLKGEDNITLLNLQELYGNSPIDISKEQQRVLDHDRIVFQFPLFWYNAPGILKTYLDSVFCHGFAFGAEGSKVSGKEFLMAVSTGGDKEKYEEHTISDCLKCFELSALYMGMRNLPTYVFYGALNASMEDIEKASKEYVDHIKSNF